MRSGRRAVAVAMLLATLAALAAPVHGLLIDPVAVEGMVQDPEGAPLEGVLVTVVGMEEFNATTDDNGSYAMVVPYLEAGQTLRFFHPDHTTREVPTGPMVPGGSVTVNVTLALKPPQARLHIVLLPWSPVGTNYGLRMDTLTVVNASGTQSFLWTEKTADAEVKVPAPGTYLVTGTRPGYYPGTVVVTVGRGDRVNVDIDLSDLKKPTYGVVNGTVEHRGAPLANVTVVAEPAEGEGARSFNAVTDALGMFVLTLPEGNFSIRVEAEGFSRLSQGVEVELGGSYQLHFPMSEAQETGSGTDPLMSLLVVGAIVAALAIVIAVALVASRRSAAARAEEASRSTELRCPSCDALAPVEADRCAECGTVFPWKSFRCPDCGAQMALDATRCPECGNQTFDLHRG